MTTYVALALYNMSTKFWFADYNTMQLEVSEAEASFNNACIRLNLNPYMVIKNKQPEIIANIVHESNWRENIQLNPNSVKSLTEAAFTKLNPNNVANIDMDGYIYHHKENVIKLKEIGASYEEIATYNLSSAYIAIEWILENVIIQTTAFLSKPLWEFQNQLSEQDNRLLNSFKKFAEEYEKNPNNINADIVRENTDTPFIGSELINFINYWMNSNDDIIFPPNIQVYNKGDYFKALIREDISSLRLVFKEEYIHFLHIIIGFGILPLEECGVYRKIRVHFDNPNITLPEPENIPELMKYFTMKFPIYKIIESDNIIKLAAEIMYKFVMIHPYKNGNGRVSRLLMNLILHQDYPPIYIKSTKSGIRAFKHALSKAHRNDINSLALLISISIKEMFEALERDLPSQPF